MTSTLLIVQIVLTILIVVAVLLQKSSSIGLGAYSGSNESVFGAKGPGGFLAKATFFIGFLFVVNTVTLGYFYNEQKNESIIDTAVIPEAPVDATAESLIPEAPRAPSAK